MKAVKSPIYQKHLKILVSIAFVVSLFCLAIAVDVSPLVRGPDVWPDGWRYEYSYTNTISKSPVPIAVFVLICAFFAHFDHREKDIEKNEKRILLVLCFLGFAFLLSIFFYSSAGVPVLLHRIIHQEINGYFTEVLRVGNALSYLKEYVTILPTNVGHAVSHPPGSIFLFWIVIHFFEKIPYGSLLGNSIAPGSDAVQVLWHELTEAQKSAALFNSVAVPFVSFFAIFPLYYLTKYLTNRMVAFRSALFFIFILSIIFFTPITDIILPVLGLSALYLAMTIQGKMKSIAGVILSLGVFVSLSLVPYLFILFIYYGWLLLKKELSFRSVWDSMVYVLLGFSSLPFFLLFLGYNSIEVAYVASQSLPASRPYLTWIFYTFYDFFIFSGIPLSALYLIGFQKLLNENKRLQGLILAFSIVIVLLALSGAVQGEIGRIWVVFSPFIAIFAGITVFIFIIG